MYLIYIIILFNLIFPFRESCGPPNLFSYINDNCPEYVCSESVFESWKKNYMNTHIDKFYIGISGEHYSIQNGKSYDEAVKNLIDTRNTKYSSDRSLKIDYTSNSQSGMVLDRDYSSDFKASSYGTLKKPTRIHKKIGDKYITYVYKCIYDYEDDIEEYQKELLDEVDTYYSKYIDSREMNDYNLAFEYLAYSYLYANSLIKNHPKIAEINKQLMLLLGNIKINFTPPEVNNVPVFVDNNRSVKVSALYNSTPLDNFKLQAYFDKGMGEWENNKEVFSTDSEGDLRQNLTLFY